jgi:hypothetical protein
MQNIFLILGFAKAFGSIYALYSGQGKTSCACFNIFNKERLLDKPICTSWYE